jgi:RNA polymerase sigma factor (sigma-70 family)
MAARENRANARARLVEAFMPLIGSVARVYYHVPAVEKSELMQEGVVGVLRALERYDPELGTPFWAYASWWVRQAMQQLVSELSRPVVLSDRALRQLAHVRDARRTFLCVRGREPSQQELASVSDLTMEQLQKLAVAERQPRSLEEPVDARAGGTARIGDLLSDPLAEEVYEQLALHLGATEVPRLLGHLTGRERRVIEARYGLDGPERTLRELGEILGVSAERVRQIEQVALEKMRDAGSGECGSAPERKLQGRVGIPSRSPRTPRRPSGQLPRSADRRKPRPRRRGEV